MRNTSYSAAHSSCVGRHVSFHVGVAIFVHSLSEKDPFFLQARHSSGAKYNFGVILRIAVFVAGMLSFLSLVRSFLRLRAILKRHNRVMSELHGLNRESDQIKQKKLLRTVIEVFACFVVGYIPLFVVNILQHQGKFHSVDPIVVARAIFLMTYATNVLVYGRYSVYEFSLEHFALFFVFV